VAELVLFPTSHPLRRRSEHSARRTAQALDHSSTHFTSHPQFPTSATSPASHTTLHSQQALTRKAQVTPPFMDPSLYMPRRRQEADLPRLSSQQVEWYQTRARLATIYGLAGEFLFPRPSSWRILTHRTDHSR